MLNISVHCEEHSDEAIARLDTDWVAFLSFKDRSKMHRPTDEPKAIYTSRRAR